MSGNTARTFSTLLPSNRTSTIPFGAYTGAEGAVEFYGFARSTLSFNALSGTKWFSTWLTKDVAFEWGGDANTENNQFSPEVRKLDLGLSFSLKSAGHR